MRFRDVLDQQLIIRNVFILRLDRSVLDWSDSWFLTSTLNLARS